MNKTYHGGSKSAIKSIMKNVDVSLGSGELGLGFYTQKNKTGAMRFAEGRHGSKDSACVELDIDHVAFTQLTCEYSKNEKQGLKKIKWIQNKSRTKLICFNKDYVVYPLLNEPRVIQYKFESVVSEAVLNEKNKTLNKDKTVTITSKYFKEL